MTRLHRCRGVIITQPDLSSASERLITGQAPSEFAPARFHQLTMSIG